MPPFAGHRIETWEPSWPLDVQDGASGLIWAVFVDEPAGAAPATPPERARRAAAAWLFSLRVFERQE